MRLAPSLFALSLLTATAGCGSDDSTGADPGAGGFPDAGGTAGGGAAGGGAGGGTQGGGITGGGTQGGAAGGTTGGNLCSIQTIDAYANPPDMLILLDRSGSMLAQRWQPSQQAVSKITQDYGGLIDFGLEMFPSDMSCGAGKLDVPLAPNNGGPISQLVNSTTPFPFAMTPTADSLRAALTILGDRNASLDNRPKPAYVLLVTDGEPSCTLGAPDPGQVDGSKAAVQALKAANIPTYVLGYQIGGNAQALMNELAQLGGTGTYKAVESADAIVTTFQEITKDVVRCDFELSEQPGDPRFVRVQIDGQSVPLAETDGWKIEGKHVTLVGSACATLKDGKPHILNAQVECDIVVVN